MSTHTFIEFKKKNNKNYSRAPALQPDAQPTLPRVCFVVFEEEVEESNFSMGCIIGEKGNDLESDPLTLSMKIWRKYYPRKKSRKDRQIHGKLRQVVEWLLLSTMKNFKRGRHAKYQPRSQGLSSLPPLSLRKRPWLTLVTWHSSTNIFPLG